VSNSTTTQGAASLGHSVVISPHLEFRADIEGLRALAIVLVVACHAGIPWLQGGFIGVDVFFVLSGYLISGLLIKEVNATGKINLLDFYSRRLKRLLPALLAMTIGTILLGIVILAPFEQQPQASTVRWVPYWITNFIFSFAELNYFAADAKTNLFLHTWSLAVEEQFYLIWPVLIFALYKGIKLSKKFSFERIITEYFIVIFLLFLLLCVFLSYVKPLWGFYLMPSRGWQFALGALTYVISTHGIATYSDVSRAHADVTKVYSLTSWAGLILIVSGSLFLNDRMAYPGFYALIPSFGAAFLIFSGSSLKLAVVSRILSSSPMQFIGKISYSWYLWHWPILVLGNAFYAESGFLYQLILVIISILFAVITMAFVETPLRNNQILIQRPAFTVALALVLMMGGYWIGSSWQYKSEGWANSPEQFIYGQIRRNIPVIYPMGCDSGHLNSIVRLCNFGDKGSDKTAVLFGDSVGAQWFPGLVGPLLEQNWRLVVLTKSSCPMVDEPWFYPRIGEEYTVCSDWRNTSLQVLKDLEPDIIFMGSAAEYGFTPLQWQNGTQGIIDELTESVGKIYLIPGSYRLPFDGPGCLARKEWQHPALSGLYECSTVAGSFLDESLFTALSNAANEYENVGILDLNPLICPDNQCAAKLGGKIVYRDYQHIATSFVDSISSEIIATIEDVQFNPAPISQENLLP